MNDKLAHVSLPYLLVHLIEILLGKYQLYIYICFDNNVSEYSLPSTLEINRKRKKITPWCMVIKPVRDLETNYLHQN